MSQTSKALHLPADPLIGHALGGKYVIKRLIGRGGVGLVYLADQLDVDREVVVKVLAPNWADDDEALARFEREARRLSGLKHPNIVTMLDFGKEGRRAYLVMEYLQGESLSDYVERQGRLTLEEFVPIAAQILKGIGHTHSREMMVRDIKPANIMLCVRKGRANFVKILDFGLAKLTKGEKAITEEHVMGTVGYLSPEQIRGDEIDLRVDVYALGVLFYYMLSGHLPFEGDNNATVFYKTINEPPRRLTLLLPEGHDIPEGLIDLIHSCLEKDREDRPANADEIVEGLIDVVPAAMFRLPRAETQRSGVPAPMPPGHGNTGMMELLGTDVSPSSRHSVDTGQLAAAVARASSPSTPSSIDARDIGDSDDSGPLPVPPTGAHAGVPTSMQPAAAPPGRSAMLLVAGALLAVIGGGVGVWLVMDKGSGDASGGVAAAGTPGPAAVGTPAPPAEVDPKVVEAALAEADRLTSAGSFDAATAKLDEVRGLTQALPTLAGRIERADQKVATLRLMAAGSKFEAEDKRDAATEAYRDALELDPSYLPAREALARLDVDVGPLPAGAEDVVFGQVTIDSRPSGAKIYVDGNPAGTTPFTGKLRVGDHEVRIIARGYYVYNESYSVAAADNVPMKVDLKGRGKGGKPGKDDEGDAPETTKAESKTETKTETKTESKPSSGSGSGKSNPFLPTKKGGDEPKQPTDEPKKKPGGGSPFLPTKD